MRLVEADLDRTRITMPNLWSLVKARMPFGATRRGEAGGSSRSVWKARWKPAATSGSRCPGINRRPRGRPTATASTRANAGPPALGLLENVRVPRCRDKAFTQQMLARLDHHRDDLGQSAVDMLLAGVSTRRVGELLERIIRLPVSAGQVSRLAKRLDAAVRQFHTCSLEDEYVYLLLDAIYLKARGAPRLIETGLRRSRKRVVWVAYQSAAADCTAGVWKVRS